MSNSSIVLALVFVLLSRLICFSKDTEEEQADLGNSSPKDPFQIVSVHPADGSLQVSPETTLTAGFNSEIDNETVFPGSITLIQNSRFIQGNLMVDGKSLIFQLDDNLSHASSFHWMLVIGIRDQL